MAIWMASTSDRYGGQDVSVTCIAGTKYPADGDVSMACKRVKAGGGRKREVSSESFVGC